MRCPGALVVPDGAAVLELLAANGLSGVQARTFGVPDHFIEHGAPDILKKLCGLTADDFAAAALDGKPPAISEADTMGNMKVLDEIRRQIGLVF